MNRARLALLASLVVTGCAGLIGVPDLTFDESAAKDGGPTVVDATPGANDATTTTDGGGVCATDTASDPRNCGRCGHTCGAGACSGGVCQPFTLVDGVTLAQHALDDRFVYYVDFFAKKVLRIAKDGSGQPETVLSDIGNPVGLAVQGSTLFYTSQNDGTFRCTIADAGTCQGSTLVVDQYFSQNIGAGDGGVFVGTQSGVYRYVPGKPDAGPLPGSDSYNVSGGLAVSNDWVYFYSGSAFLHRNQVDGGGADSEQLTALYSDSNDGYVAVDGDRFFYAAGNDTTKVALVGSALETNKDAKLTYATTGYPIGIAADARYVYWSDRGTLNVDGTAKDDGTLYACPRGGCAGAPLTLATGLHGAGFIALDTDFVYFAENNNFGRNGRIRAVAKP